MTNEAPRNDRAGAEQEPAQLGEFAGRISQLRDYAARVTTESELHLAERELAQQRVQALQAGLEALHALAQSTDDAAIIKQAISELREAAKGTQ